MEYFFGYTVISSNSILAIMKRNRNGISLFLKQKIAFFETENHWPYICDRCQKIFPTRQPSQTKMVHVRSCATDAKRYSQPDSPARQRWFTFGHVRRMPKDIPRQPSQTKMVHVRACATDAKRYSHPDSPARQRWSMFGHVRRMPKDIPNQTAQPDKDGPCSAMCDGCQNILLTR